MKRSSGENESVGGGVRLEFSDEPGTKSRNQSRVFKAKDIDGTYLQSMFWKEKKTEEGRRVSGEDASKWFRPNVELFPHYVERDSNEKEPSIDVPRQR